MNDMTLVSEDIHLILLGLKAVSHDSTFSSDQRRKAKLLEDDLGLRYSEGAELTRLKPN